MPAHPAVRDFHLHVLALRVEAPAADDVGAVGELDDRVNDMQTQRADDRARPGQASEVDIVALVSDCNRDG